MPSTPHATNWDDFRLVKAIADAGTLVGAADILGINHSTVFRRLGTLEDQLKARLFERSRTAYAATAAGEEMIALARRMGEDITDFERKAAGRDITPAGDLRVTTNDTLLVYLLPPVIAGFVGLCPDIRLEMLIGNASLNLAKRDADIAIRATDEPPETLVGRRIATIAWGHYAPKAFLESGGRTDDLSAATGLRWVGYGDNLAALPVTQWLNERVGAHHVIYRVNTVLGLAEAVAAGIGQGLLPCFIGDSIAGIQRIGAPMPELGRGLWILTHPDLRHAARVRAFMDYTSAELMKRRKLLLGE